MDGQRMDRIARALASGVSRRGAMKAVAVALGLSAAGALRAPTVAEPTWSRCYYDCDSDPESEFRCTPTSEIRCRASIHVQGTLCPATGEPLCCFPSKAECEDPDLAVGA